MPIWGRCMNTRTSEFHVTIEKAAPGVEHDARFVMSASSPDRVKDTIDSAAYLPHVGKKLIALWQHNSDQPIGFWKVAASEGGKLIGNLKFATTQLAQMVKTLVQDGVPLGASIGFRGTGSENDKGGVHFKTLDLLECSVVSVPCHPEAIMIGKKFGIDITKLSDAEQVLTLQQKALVTRAAAAVAKSSSLMKEVK